MMEKSKKQKRAKRRSKKRKRQKPYADDLKEHPDLQSQLSKIQDKPHPIDTKNWFSVLTLSYIKPYLDLSKKMVVTQKCHFKLPKEDSVLSSTNKIGQKMYNSSLSLNKEFNEEIKFSQRPHPSKSLIGSLMKTYWFMLLYITLFAILVTLLDFYVVYGTKEVLTEINSQVKEKNKIYNKEKILYWFMSIWACGVLNTIFNQWMWVQSYRFIFRLTGATYSLIFMKILKIGIVNSHEHDEGSIINYLQSDIDQFYLFALTLSAITSGLINLSLSIVLGIIYFRTVFLVLVGGLVLLGFVNVFLIAGVMVLRKKKQEKTDKRINVLKNVLKNIKFIKINGIENLFVRKVNKARDEELKTKLLVKLCWIGINFVFVLGTPMIIVAFLYFYFKSGGELDVASVTILLRIFSLMEDALFQIPGSIMVWVNLMVSIRRINLFLNSKELEYKKVRKEGNIDDKDAVRIEEGYFYWDKKLTKEEAEKIRKEKLKSSKKVKKELKKWKKENKGKVLSENESSALRQTLLSQVTVEAVGEKEKEEESKFELNDLNFSAKKGVLTTVIGKTGSGKTTLLYSILGETMIKDFSKTKVTVNGKICFCGQNPWLINGTVKENITLGKEFDEKKFKWALKFSALSKDLKSWDDKEEHEIGERGTALSGGQKTRVVLARCLYQE